MVEMTKEEISELLALIADAKEVNEEGMRAGPIAPIELTQARRIYNIVAPNAISPSPRTPDPQWLSPS
jgi:hypothetical protein